MHSYKNLYIAPGASEPQGQLPPLPLLCWGIWGQKMPYEHAQKNPLKYGKIIIKKLKNSLFIVGAFLVY